ncbi:MAG: aldehyde dehydrogenase family protein [bacterium]
MEIQTFFSLQRFFQTETTRHEQFVRRSLTKLRLTLYEKQDALLSALHKDLGKNEIEAYTSELSVVFSEISYALKNLNAWMKPRKKPTPLFLLPGTSSVIPEPKGVVLILGPWNYPVQLLLAPLVGALSAGNCVVIKPSEFTPATAAVINDIIASTFQSDHCRVVQGDAETAQKLCTLPWDHIFFTGSTRVGRSVMQTAAANLTSVSLELGGKSPCIVLDDAPTHKAAERIVWGKFLNAGQTCIAPDTVYVQRNIAQKLIADMVRTIQRFYGNNPERSPDYGRILDARHIERLAGYLKNVNIITGGTYDTAKRYFAPTIVVNIHPKSPLAEEEIFGPILPVIEFDDVTELITELSTKPKPLALYIFSKSALRQQQIFRALPSGTVCINDTIKQAVSSTLPFGGIQESGMGMYHGKASFDCFTHYRSIFKTGYWGFSFHYPPYKVSIDFIKKIFRFFT